MSSEWTPQPRTSTDYEHKGLDTVFLENQHLRIEILTGKGGDILEFRDKRTDVNDLWETDHEWLLPNSRTLPADGPTTWNDLGHCSE